jgi:hypothetical protein
MAKWLNVSKFRAIGDRTSYGTARLGLSYMTIKNEDLKKIGLLEELADHEDWNEKFINVHFMSGHTVEAENAGEARLKLITEVSDLFEEEYGYRLYVNQNMDDTLI